jgi:hypothetical protein
MSIEKVLSGIEHVHAFTRAVSVGNPREFETGKNQGLRGYRHVNLGSCDDCGVIRESKREATRRRRSPHFFPVSGSAGGGHGVA